MIPAVIMMSINWPYRISDVIQDSAATGLGIEHLQAQVPIYCLSKSISDGKSITYVNYNYFLT